MNKKKHTHNLIIEESAKLFNKKGYAGTAISDIMQATGLKKGGIYSHFSDKKEIAFAAFEYLVKKIFSEFKSIDFENRSSIDKLHLLLGKQQELYSSEFLSGGCPFLNIGTEADDTEKDMLEIVKLYVNKWKKFIINIVNTGIKAKEISSKIDAETFASNYIALIEGGNFLAKLYSAPSYRESAIKQIENIIEYELKRR